MGEIGVSFEAAVMSRTYQQQRSNQQDIDIWRQIYQQFEDAFGRLFLKDDNKKKKAHVDNGDEETSNALIHEPQLKWSLILFFDAMVQIATNNSFTSKQQSCVDRRQFNHHTYLKKCIDVALGNTASDSMSKPIAKVTPELDERCLVLPALSTSSSISSKSTKRVTPDLEERSVIAPPAILTSTFIQAPAHVAMQVKSKASTQALASSFFSSMGMNSGMNNSIYSIPTTVSSTYIESSTSEESNDDDDDDDFDDDVLTLQPPKKVRKQNEKKKDRKTTYCSWVDNWGSFEKLADGFDVYSGGGKSAIRHATLARVLIHKLSMVSTADINAVVPGGPRRATWQEVFDYVLRHPGQMAPVSLRTARKSLAEARRLQLLQGHLPPLPCIYFPYSYHFIY